MKRFMIDSNIFFLDPCCIEKFEDNEVYVPITVLEELDKHKSDNGLNGFNIRKSIKKLESNPSIKFVSGYDDCKLDMEINDNKIIGSAKKYDCILITNDVAMRVKSTLVGVDAQQYKNVDLPEVGNIRTGKHYIDDDKLLAEFYQKEELPKAPDMFENDFVLFGKPDDVVEIAQVKGDLIVKTKIKNYKPSGIKFKNLDQKLMAQHLSNKELELVSVTGTMGVGKNFVTLAVALDLLDKGVYDKIFISKPPIALNRDFQLGYRPNGFIEKVMPTLTSFTSNLANLAGDKKQANGVEILQGHLTFNTIEILDLENLQGISLPKKSILILDEFQLIEGKNDARALLSRCGEDSLIVCSGDLKQLASQKHNIEESGLYHLIHAFSGYEKYAHITLDKVVRSGFIRELEKRW